MADRTESITIEIEKPIKDSLQALADRDPGLSVDGIIRRGIMAQLGLSDIAINFWELEDELSNAPVFITPGAAALIAKTLELSPEELEELRALDEDIDELKEAMKALDEKFK